jgi:hypothetical protein
VQPLAEARDRRTNHYQKKDYVEMCGWPMDVAHNSHTSSIDTVLQLVGTHQVRSACNLRGASLIKDDVDHETYFRVLRRCNTWTTLARPFANVRLRIRYRRWCERAGPAFVVTGGRCHVPDRVLGEFRNRPEFRSFFNLIRSLRMRDISVFFYM